MNVMSALAKWFRPPLTAASHSGPGDDEWMSRFAAVCIKAGAPVGTAADVARMRVARRSEWRTPEIAGEREVRWENGGR